MKEKYLVRVENVSKYFGGLRAVEGIDFHIFPGEIKSIIGPNGAGKTTLFNLIAGLYKPTRGEIFFKGQNITKKSIDEVSKIGITKTYQITHIFPNLSVWENVRMAAQKEIFFFNFWSKIENNNKVTELTHHILKSVKLIEKRTWPANHLSHGEKRHLEIAIALATKPTVLLLDEPTAGMGPNETIETKFFITQIMKEFELTIIIIEHDMSVVMDISDEIVVLNEGKVIAVGRPEEISCNAIVQSVYLGERPKC